jgi:hypothetical protein
MKKILALILYDKKDLIINKRKIRLIKYLKKIISDDEKLYLIDLTSFYLGKLAKDKYSYEDEQTIYFKPKNFIDLKNFKKDKIIYGVGPINPGFRNIVAFLFLRYLNVKLILINYFGYFLNETSQKKKLIETIHLFFNRNFNYIFFRILSIFSIVPKIKICFETSQVRIKEIENSISKKIENKFNFIKISYFEKIFRINSIYFDEILFNEKFENLSEDLVFIDSGVDHADNEKESIIHTRLINKQFTVNHYKNVCKKLTEIAKIYKTTKIFFCKHPKAKYYPECFDDYKNILINNDADKHIWSAKLVIFSGGSSMFNKAIILKKRILVFISKETAPYNKRLINSLNKIFKVNILDIDADIIDDNLTNDKYFNNLEYDNFINKNLIYDKNIISPKIIRSKIFN